MGQKTCTSCGEPKPLDAFYRKTTGAQGREARCIACKSAARKAAYKADPAKALARNAAWRAANPDAKRASNVAYRQANLDRLRAADRARAASLTGEALERKRATDRKAQAKRQAEKLDAAIGTVDEASVLASTDTCYLCGKRLSGPVHLDHIVPLARGGAHCDGNLAPTHAACNLSKNDRLLCEVPWYSGPVGLGVALARGGA